MIFLAIVVFVALIVAFYWACTILWNLLLECPWRKRESNERPYMDNSEYDYGHNVKHYIEENL